MEPFLSRLLIGALTIFVVNKVVELLKLKTQAADIINAITIIGAVIYIVFGGLLKFN